jgi:predicted unusual protein kinase regulating ubiquinone biosynthesis (AarF/ABC1/UbiB family)
VDKAPWKHSDIDWETINQLENEHNIYFYNNHEPINAGMISLIFKVHKKDDQNNELIIKMKRKNINTELDNAINNLLFLLYFLLFLPVLNTYIKSCNIIDVVSKNIGLIKEQTNFSTEINNTNIMKDTCKHLKYVKIPKIYESYTKIFPNIILMEFISGMSLNKVHQDDYETFAKLVMKFCFSTLLIHGFSHGDLHSGNILFIKNDKNDKNYLLEYQIGIIDFGILCHIDKEFQNKIFQLFFEMLLKPSREIAINIINCGTFECTESINNLPCNHYNELIDIFTQIIDETLQKKHGANHFQIYSTLSQITTYLKKHNLNSILKLSDDFVKIQMALAMSHGITSKLCHDDSLQLANNVFNEMFNTDLFLNKDI